MIQFSPTAFSCNVSHYCHTAVAIKPKTTGFRTLSAFGIVALLPQCCRFWPYRSGYTNFNTGMPQLASCLVFLILQDTNAFAYCQRDTSSTRESLAVRMNRMTQNDAKQLGELCEKLVKPMSYDFLNDAYGIKLISPTAFRKYKFSPQKAGATDEKTGA